MDLPRTRDSDSVSTSSSATKVSKLGALNPLRRTPSRESVDLRFCTLNFTLGQLCDFISVHPSLQTAGIVSCSCYAQRSSFLSVKHRFLILQLRRTGRSNGVWLRLDRRRSAEVGMAHFSLASGVTPSNDTVRLFLLHSEYPKLNYAQAMLAGTREALLQGCPVRENELVFEPTYPLEILRLTLVAINAEMKEYKLTSASYRFQPSG